jgi:hypothetical protein
LNSKGKEYVAKQLVTFIETKSNKSEQTVNTFKLEEGTHEGRSVKVRIVLVQKKFR